MSATEVPDGPCAAGQLIGFSDCCLPATPAASDGVEAAIAAIASGKFVVVLDNEDGEKEGDLIMAAELVTPEAMAFTVRHTSGLVCVDDWRAPRRRPGRRRLPDHRAGSAHRRADPRQRGLPERRAAQARPPAAQVSRSQWWDRALLSSVSFMLAD